MVDKGEICVKKYLSSLLCAAILFLMLPVSAVLAYPGGFANGKVATLSMNRWSTDSVTNFATDNDETTGVTINKDQLLMIDLGASYDIKSLRVKSTDDTSLANSLRMNFYNASKQLIDGHYADTTLYYYPLDGTQYNYVVSNIRYVEFFSRSTIPQTVYELDVFGTPAPVKPPIPNGLIATSGNDQVTLTWSAVTGATGYNVKRSTTAGGPYTTVASNVYGSPYTDTTVTNGTKYYYVVTALNAGGESGNSNEASATPMGTSRIILTTTMTNGDTFEYNLSQTELTTFLAWFEAKAAGTGPAKYTFTNQHLKGSFLARKNSLIFDKILKFKYDEYSISGSGTPTEVAEITAGTALSITLTDGKVEEFILSAADYNAFVAWHDAKAAGTGPARYTFENPLKKGPFIARHEVVIFDKISSYDSEDFN